MFEPEDVYFVASTLRPYLRKMLGDDQAVPLEKDIDGLLQRAEGGEKVDNLLLDRLTKEDKLREWLKTALLDETTRSLTKDRTLEPLLGDVGPISTLHFVCPYKDCDFVWHLRRVGQPVPNCPIHQTALILASQEN